MFALFFRHSSFFKLLQIFYREITRDILLNSVILLERNDYLDKPLNTSAVLFIYSVKMCLGIKIQSSLFWKRSWFCCFRVLEKFIFHLLYFEQVSKKGLKFKIIKCPDNFSKYFQLILKTMNKSQIALEKLISLRFPESEQFFPAKLWKRFIFYIKMNAFLSRKLSIVCFHMNKY